MKTLALIGCGTLGSIIAEGVTGTMNEYYKIKAVFDPYTEAAVKLAEKCGAEVMADVDQLIACGADYVIEAAAPAVLKGIAGKVLESGCDLIPLSVGAFADTEFFKFCGETARRLGRKVHIPSGAIGGFDIMGAAMEGGNVTAKIFNIKPPEALEGAPYLEGRTLSREKEEVIFSGNAVEAIEAFPKNVNVAVALSIATTGPENTRVEITSVPGLPRNTHKVVLDGNFGTAEISIASAPSANPRSSALAAYSVLARLRRMASPIEF